jgi:hypothetical protein
MRRLLRHSQHHAYLETACDWRELPACGRQFRFDILMFLSKFCDRPGMYQPF